MSKSPVKTERQQLAVKPAERLPFTRPRQQVKFEGRIEALKGYIYDCTDSRQADQYVKTTREIAGYVATALKNGNDVRTAIETMSIPKMDLPSDLPANATAAQKRHWEKRIDEISKKELILEENMKTLFSIIWGQVSDVLKHRIQALKDFKRMNSEGDALALLTALRNQAFNFQSQKDQAEALHEAVRRFYLINQGKVDSCQTYMERYENGFQVIKHIGGGLPVFPALVNADLKVRGIDPDEATTTEIEESRKNASERQLAMGYILGCDRVRFGKMIEDLENQHTQGIKAFPQTLAEAYTLANNWKNRSGSVQRYNMNDGTVFATKTVTTNKKKRNKDHITCFKCGVAGHYANECDNATTENVEAVEGKQFLSSEIHDMDDDEGGDDVHMNEFMLYNNPCKHLSDVVPRNWILLDNQSTVDVFHNKELLVNVRESGRVLNIHCNAGVASTSTVGDLPGYGEVWLYEEGIANILSLSRVKERFRITYDSENGNQFVVHLRNGKNQVFSQSKAGLYYSVVRGNTKQSAIKRKVKSIENHTTLNTVADNKTNYTKREIMRASLARRIHKTIGHPSLRKFIDIVVSNQLPNCPIVKRDILIAEDIFGPELGCLKGKTTRVVPTPVKITHAASQLSASQRNVVLAIDIMYVNEIPFLVTISRDLQFGSAQAMGDETYKSIYVALSKLIKLYTHYGFKVSYILGDGQFEHLDPSKIAPGVTVNVVTKGEHVPEVERYIRTLKERTRSVYNSLPFRRFPTKLLVEIVYAQVFWLNSFPADNGMSRTESPRLLVSGVGIDYNLHCKLECGSYVQTHEDHGNDMKPRTIGALALRPTGNVQGGFYFYNLATGCIISRRRWTSLPMPDEVIDVVHKWAMLDKSHKGVVYGDDADISYNSVPADLSDKAMMEIVSAEVQDDTHDGEGEEIAGVGEYVDADNAVAEISGVGSSLDLLDDDTITGVGNGNDETSVSIGESTALDSTDDVTAEVGRPDEENGALMSDEGADHDEEDITDAEFSDESVVPESTGNETAESMEDPSGTGGEDETDVEATMNERYGERSGHYNLRPRRERNYDRWNDTVLTNYGSDENISEGVVHTQYYVHQGLKLFGKAGEDAITTELRQLHIRQVIEPLYSNSLTQKEKEDALPYLMFLKKKHTGQVKGRGCADGRKQRIYMQKDDTSSPTVAIESLFLSATLDAFEKRDVATVDIPGAFMQADMVGKVYMKLEGKIADLLTELDPGRYRKYIENKNGKSTMYVRLRKALYGTLQAALLFWQDLTKTLVEWGFTVNPYDRCVANKVVDGKQCTVLWHVDDLKISHVDKKVVNSVIDYLASRYGKEAPLTINRGKIHRYLGMVLDFSIDGKVQISMEDYMTDLLASLPEEMAGESATPAGNHLFNINPEAVRLSLPESELFHHYVAKLLFLCKRARPDIQTAVAFLSTRVKSPDQDDLKKLYRVMRYLRFTQHLPLTLEVNGSVMPRWWVDASFATHTDMRSHTGGVMSMGKGAVWASSRKQKINTRSSTEAELVGVNDTLPQVLWTRYFLEAQGYVLSSPSKVYQDNMSSIQLEKNGKASSGQRTRHINIRYFFVTDRVTKKEVEMIYCPTGEMLADLLTKPLQGSQFKRFRDMMLNVQDATSTQLNGVSMLHRSVLKGNYRDGVKQAPEMNHTRTVKVKDLHVSWKWPLSRVVTDSSDLCSQTIRRTNKNISSRGSLVLPAHKYVRSRTRGSLPVIEYRKVSWPCTRRARKLA